MNPPDQTPLAKLPAMLELQTDYAVHRHVTSREPLEKMITLFTEWPFYHDSFVSTCSATDNAEWMRCIRNAVSSLPSVISPSEVFAHLRCSLLPGMRARIEDVRQQEEKKTYSGFAGFTYEYHPEYFGPPEPNLLTLHFRNAFMPDSPFKHGQELHAGLREIIRRTRAERPDVTRVQCATWLNNVERFTHYFPPDWEQNGTKCPLEGHSGWWGQFVDRTGNLHTARATEFRRTWQFRYPNRHCQCSMEAFESHLTNQVHTDVDHSTCTAHRKRASE